MYYTLENSDRLVTNVLLKLIQNQNLLKCIKHSTKDALSRPDLTDDEIESMYDANNQEMLISFTPFNLSTPDTEKTEVRIFIRQFIPEYDSISKVSLAIQVITHNRLWCMNDGRIRPLMIVSEILKCINGTDIDFVGLLEVSEPVKLYSYNAHFSGYEIYPSVRIT